MPSYLIDANLPYYFSLWNNENHIHQNDLNDEAKDSQIWEYAKNDNLTIITKDSDFSTKILTTLPPPKIIHIRLGNIKTKDFHTILFPLWDKVLELSKTNKLVTLYLDRIETVK